MTMKMELTTGERRLLETYATGPRIWDASELAPTVWSLQDKGLIGPSGPGAAYRLTETGLNMLGRGEAAEESHTHTWLAGMVYVADEDVATVAASRRVECETCGAIWNETDEESK